MSKIKYDDTDYLINREESIEYKTSDINVGSIEKDIRRCEQLIKPEHASWIGISNQLAIAHLIDKIKELEEKNKHLKYLYDDCCKCLLDTIEKQKVKDKIEELRKEYEIALEENSTKAFILKCKISALEELLEEK